jgi:hypothetical protein
MERLFFYVTPVDDGWEVRQGEKFHGLAPFYANSADALINAVESARQAWESQRLATGVRVQDSHGQWRDEVIFGSGLPVNLDGVARLTRRHRAGRPD